MPVGRRVGAGGKKVLDSCLFSSGLDIFHATQSPCVSGKQDCNVLMKTTPEYFCCIRGWFLLYKQVTLPESSYGKDSCVRKEWACGQLHVSFTWYVLPRELWGQERGDPCRNLWRALGLRAGTAEGLGAKRAYWQTHGKSEGFLGSRRQGRPGRRWRLKSAIKTERAPALRFVSNRSNIWKHWISWCSLFIFTMRAKPGARHPQGGRAFMLKLGAWTESFPQAEATRLGLGREA